MKTYQTTLGLRGKVIFIMMALLITSLSSLAVATYDHPTDSISMAYSFQTPSMSKVTLGNDVYDQITLQGTAGSGSAGEPSLPTKGAYLLLPPNSNIDTIMVTGEKQHIGAGFTIVPCCDPTPIAPRASISSPLPDNTVYTSHDLFPGSLYTEVGVYHFRGYTILVLMLHPVQYLPATGDLYYYPKIDVTVTLAEEKQTSSFFRGLPRDHSEVIAKVDNPWVADTYPDSSSYPLTEQYDLLILTNDTLKNGFIPLAQAHNATGINTTIRTLTDVGGNTPENIRDYIRTAYATWGIDYVLLGGDADVIPAKMLWVQGMDENITHYEDYMPVDLYYACLDGTYNYDGDEKWGEPTDGNNGSDVDLIAEVAVGRACVGTLGEVSNFVSKTVAYLSSAGEDYLGIATFAGEYLGDHGIASFGDTYLDQLIDGSDDDGYTTVGLSSARFTIDTLYDHEWPGDTGWPPQEIINRINNGVHIINHLGHANYDYDMRLENSDVDALTNDKFCFIYSQGCMAGGFDGRDCIAEHYTVKTGHGAFAGIWNARYGFFWSNSTDGDSQRYQRQFWDAVYGRNITEIGRANQKSKEDNLFLIQRSCMRWCYYETNLFGDPAVAFQTAPPKPHLTITSVKGGLSGISAVITNNGNVSVHNIDWSMTMKGGLLGRINTSSSDALALLNIGETKTVDTSNMTLFGLGKVTITVTMKYAEPWTGTAFILGPFVLRVIRSC